MLKETSEYVVTVYKSKQETEDVQLELQADVDALRKKYGLAANVFAYAMLYELPGTPAGEFVALSNCGCAGNLDFLQNSMASGIARHNAAEGEMTRVEE